MKKEQNLSLSPSPYLSAPKLNKNSLSLFSRALEKQKNKLSLSLPPLSL